MTALTLGAAINAAASHNLGLPGRWAVWSQAAADGPGAYFITPSDDQARALGLKYAVIRAQMGRTAVEPTLTLLRTDPHKPELLQPTKGTRR